MNNFSLTNFLTENGLTEQARLLKEQSNEPAWYDHLENSVRWDNPKVVVHDVIRFIERNFEPKALEEEYDTGHPILDSQAFAYIEHRYGDDLIDYLKHDLTPQELSHIAGLTDMQEIDAIVQPYYDEMDHRDWTG